MKYLILSGIVLFSIISQAQSNKGYIVEIDGDSLSVSLDEPAKIKLKDGKTVNILLRRKAFLEFSHGPVSFTHPSIFSVTSTKIDEDTDQILLMSARGTGIMVQIYSSINPQGIIEFMLNQLTEDDKNAGYTETRTDAEKTLTNGIIARGKKSVLKLENEERSFSVFSYGKGKKGVLIIELVQDIQEEEKDDKSLLEQFWKTVSIQY